MLARIIMNEKGVLPEKLNPKYLFTAWMRASKGLLRLQITKVAGIFMSTEIIWT
jgi:hypothetical protein